MQISIEKIRIILLTSTILIVGFLGIVLSFYARGYKFNFKSLKFEPNGILVVKSDPTGAQIFINEDLKTTTDASISLSPGTYDLCVRKEGFLDWSKRVSIEKEVVTEVFSSLFKSVPSLTPVTFTSALDPISSEDNTKIAYYVPPLEEQSNDKVGLWIIENVNLPIGFTKEPRKITDGSLINATWEFSPNGNKILLRTSQGNFLLDSGSYTPQNERVNIGSKYITIKQEWQAERLKKIQAKLRNLPDELEKIFLENTETISFSPDENKILYVASSSAHLKEDVVKPFPGASTQKQERNLYEYHTYVYNIREDRNFLIDSNAGNLIVATHRPENATRKLAWFPNSHNLVYSEESIVTIMDYDGTNKQKIYDGAYVSPHAFPFVSTSKIIILTNLGANSSTPNLYSITIK